MNEPLPHLPVASWKRMSFKGNKVWVAVDADARVIVEKGKVLIKYNLDQAHHYWIARKNLKAEDQAVPGTARDNLPANVIKIFAQGTADGDPGNAGIGVVLLFKSREKRISRSIGQATPSRAGLAAIKEGLSALKRQDLPVRIFTDSGEAIKLLGKGKDADAGLVTDIRQLMDQIPDIGLIHVKHHAGIRAHEVAAYLAATAAVPPPE